jgi:hypothetical protein
LFFGPDPTDPSFGASRFAVADTTIWDAHSAYFEPNSASLNNLTFIVLGRDDMVTRPDDVEAALSE